MAEKPVSYILTSRPLDPEQTRGLSRYTKTSVPTSTAVASALIGTDLPAIATRQESPARENAAKRIVLSTKVAHDQLTIQLEDLRGDKRTWLMATLVAAGLTVGLAVAGMAAAFASMVEVTVISEVLAVLQGYLGTLFYRRLDALDARLDKRNDDMLALVNVAHLFEQAAAIEDPRKRDEALGKLLEEAMQTSNALSTPTKPSPD